MYHYAILDGSYVCTHIYANVKKINTDDFTIAIGAQDVSVIGKVYNNGMWEDAPPVQPDPLTPTEQAILETAINTDYLVCLKDMGL